MLQQLHTCLQGQAVQFPSRTQGQAVRQSALILATTASPELGTLQNPQRRTLLTTGLNFYKKRLIVPACKTPNRKHRVFLPKVRSSKKSAPPSRQGYSKTVQSESYSAAPERQAQPDWKAKRLRYKREEDRKGSEKAWQGESPGGTQWQGPSRGLRSHEDFSPARRGFAQSANDGGQNFRQDSNQRLSGSSESETTGRNIEQLDNWSPKQERHSARLGAPRRDSRQSSARPAQPREGSQKKSWKPYDPDVEVQSHERLEQYPRSQTASNRFNGAAKRRPGIATDDSQISNGNEDWPVSDNGYGQTSRGFERKEGEFGVGRGEPQARPDSHRQLPFQTYPDRQSKEDWGRTAGYGHRPAAGFQHIQGRLSNRPLQPVQPYYQPREGDPVLRQVRDDWRGDALYGVNPIKAAMAAKRRDIHGLYLQEGSGPGKQWNAIQKVHQAALRQGIPCKTMSKHDLNVITNNAVHQGLVLECSPLDFEPMEDFTLPPVSSCPLWVALDEITDPHNLGAVVRSVVLMGATGILVCSTNSSPITPAVSKVSAGTIEHLPMFSCTRMHTTLSKAEKAGWRVLGAVVDDNATPCHTLSLDRPTILVLGSEGYGLRKNIELVCSDLVKVGGSDIKLPDGIDSLNVSVAAGILVHHFITSKEKLVGDD